MIGPPAVLALWSRQQVATALGKNTKNNAIVAWRKIWSVYTRKQEISTFYKRSSLSNLSK